MSWLNLPRALRQRPAFRLGEKILRIWRRAGLAGLWWQLRQLDSQTRCYADWRKREDADAAGEHARLQAELAALDSPPLISIVMPVCDPPERWLQQAIDSVRRQGYPCWELCIADDASRSVPVRQLLRAAAAADSRIRLVFRESRGHICAATRSALELATGDFITFLDHDDELAPAALAYVACEIGRHPETDLLYSDEDLIGTDGQRYNPYFKPDWNPELLRSQNYLCHLVVYRATLLHSLDILAPEVQGSQDWDLALRASERAGHIRHLPRILYHWRSLPGSTAHSDTAKRYALTAGRLAVQAQLQRCSETAEVELLPFGHLRIRRPAPDLRLSVIVFDTDGASSASAPWKPPAGPNVELVHTTLGLSSPDRSDSRLAEQLNQAARQATGDMLCFVDRRCQPTTPDWLATLAAEAARPGIGAVGARLLQPNRRVWHAGYLLDPESVVGHPYRGAPEHFAGQRNRALLQQNVSAVSATCLAVRRALFEDVNGFDPASGPYFDVDFCLRLQEQGLRNIWTPWATLVLHAATRGDAGSATGSGLARQHMQVKWREQLRQDPASHRVLSLERGLPVPRTQGQ
ncbi:MAG: glycosyltransferase [Dechloromonas sp.]|nr:MAG: glycosyltransferase [Dechloromonas sp.]